MPSPTPEVGSSNISLSGLRESWGTESYVGGSDPGSGSNSNISLSEFRGATFTNDTSDPDSSDEEISIEDDFKDKTFGAASVSFPVTSNPSIQWIVGGMEAEKSDVSTISGGGGETIDPEEYWSGISIPGTKEWITNHPAYGTSTVTRNSYTNADSDTIYYLTIPVDTNFTTKINTSGDMASTGFTGWWVMLGPSATNNWWRPFSYRGIASGDDQTITDDQVYQSSTLQYIGPLFFMNSTYSQRVEFRKPNNAAGSGITAYPLVTGGRAWEAGADNIWIFIWKISSGGITKYTTCVRDKENGFYRPGAPWSDVTDRENEDTFNNSHANFQGLTEFGLKSSTNVGKPWFNDSRYGGNNQSVEEFNLISSGWANREYTDAETILLRNKLKDLYFGVARGDA